MKLNIEDNIINKKNNVNKNSSLEEVAQEFESLYVFQMLKSGTLFCLTTRKGSTLEIMLFSKGQIIF